MKTKELQVPKKLKKQRTWNFFTDVQLFCSRTEKYKRDIECIVFNTNCKSMQNQINITELALIASERFKTICKIILYNFDTHIEIIQRTVKVEMFLTFLNFRSITTQIMDIADRLRLTTRTA